MMFLQLLTIVAVALAPAPDKKPDKKDEEKLQGTWSVTAQDSTGEGAKPPPENQIIRATFKDNEYRWENETRGGQVTKTAMAKYKFELDATKKPKEITKVNALEGSDKTPIKGIYLLEGDTLKICTSQPGKDRPTEFAVKPDSGCYLLVLKRQER